MYDWYRFLKFADKEVVDSFLFQISTRFHEPVPVSVGLNDSHYGNPGLFPHPVEVRAHIVEIKLDPCIIAGEVGMIFETVADHFYILLSDAGGLKIDSGSFGSSTGSHRFKNTAV